MADLQYPKYEGRFDAPIQGTIGAITPNDGADLSRVIHALNVGVTGDVKVTFVDGTEGVMTLASGALHRMLVKRVWSTGTTATGIKGFY